MEAAGSGTVNRVNLSVGDIYGGDYANVGLPANVTAAFFGKATRTDDPRGEIVDADIAKSLIQMIAQNVTHIAFMVAHMRSVIYRCVLSLYECCLTGYPLRRSSEWCLQEISCAAT
jgi:pantothenate kinase